MGVSRLSQGETTIRMMKLKFITRVKPPIQILGI
jgi:hypothetical protein